MGVSVASSWPFFSFGALRFRSTERPLPGTDKGWQYSPTLARSRPLGSTRDDIVVLAVGSQTREFEALFDPDRFSSLRSLINTAGVFTDNDRPSPGQQQAFLVNVEALDRDLQSRRCDVVGAHSRIRAKVSLISA